MQSLAQILLALAVTQAPPGLSPYSRDILPECGQHPSAPTCAPACADPSCKIKWSPERKAWTRMESRENAFKRYIGITQALADTASRLLCEDPKGNAYPLQNCERIDWPDSAKMLSFSLLTVVLHESSLREDVEFGHGPKGRGAMGEACLVQVMPSQAARHAMWLSPSERELAIKDKSARESFARSLLGDSKDALSRCFEAGIRMLAAARKNCSGSRILPWDFAMFSQYGSGRTCNLPEIADKRVETLHTLTASKAVLDPFYAALLSASGNASKNAAPSQ